jgi:hypothetical protein
MNRTHPFVPASWASTPWEIAALAEKLGGGTEEIGDK